MDFLQFVQEVSGVIKKNYNGITKFLSDDLYFYISLFIILVIPLYIVGIRLTETLLFIVALWLWSIYHKPIKEKILNFRKVKTENN
jgi:hypothetical protein